MQVSIQRMSRKRLFSERNENNWNNYVQKLELIIHFFSFLE